MMSNTDTILETAIAIIAAVATILSAIELARRKLAEQGHVLKSE